MRIFKPAAAVSVAFLLVAMSPGIASHQVFAQAHLGETSGGAHGTVVVIPAGVVGGIGTKEMNLEPTVYDMAVVMSLYGGSGFNGSNDAWTMSDDMGRLSTRVSPYTLLKPNIPEGDFTGRPNHSEFVTDSAVSGFPAQAQDRRISSKNPIFGDRSGRTAISEEFNRYRIAAELASVVRRILKGDFEAVEKLFFGGTRFDPDLGSGAARERVVVPTTQLKYPDWLGLKLDVKSFVESLASGHQEPIGAGRIKKLIITGDGRRQGLLGQEITDEQRGLIEGACVSVMGLLGGGKEKSFRAAMKVVQSIDAVKYRNPIPEFKENLIQSLRLIYTQSLSADEFNSNARSLLDDVLAQSRQKIYRNGMFVRSGMGSSAHSGGLPRRFAKESREARLYPAVPRPSGLVKAAVFDRSEIFFLSPMALLTLLTVGSLLLIGA